MNSYKTSKTCASLIEFEVIDNLVKNVKFHGGCNGNLKGIQKLVDSKPIDEVIELLEGIDCKDRGTSCPDQLAKALKEYHQNQSL